MRDRGPVSLNQIFDNDLRLHCLGCGHIAYISGRAAIALFVKRDWPIWWTSVPRRFRCAKCSRREPEVTPVKVQPVRPGDRR